LRMGAVWRDAVAWVRLAVACVCWLDDEGECDGDCDAGGLAAKAGALANQGARTIVSPINQPRHVVFPLYSVAARMNSPCFVQPRQGFGISLRAIVTTEFSLDVAKMPRFAGLTLWISGENRVVFLFS